MGMVGIMERAISSACPLPRTTRFVAIFECPLSHGGSDASGARFIHSDDDKSVVRVENYPTRCNLNLTNAPSGVFRTHAAWRCRAVIETYPPSANGVVLHGRGRPEGTLGIWENGRIDGGILAS